MEAVEAGGFAKAADRLSLSRSAVGKAIARLEERLGVRLFHRTTRLQSLTEDGQQYYERCLRAIEELRAGESLLESGRRDVFGRLRVSMPVLFGRYCAAPILLAYARQHPRLELELSFNDRQIDLIADGVDTAIRNGVLGSGSALSARRTGEPAQGALRLSSLSCRPRAAPFAGGSGRPRYACILAQRSRADTAAPECSRRPRRRLRHLRLRFDDLEVIADAAVAGMGLARASPIGSSGTGCVQVLSSSSGRIARAQRWNATRCGRPPDICRCGRGWRSMRSSPSCRNALAPETTDPLRRPSPLQIRG